MTANKNDDWLGDDMEAEADRLNAAEPSVDWAALGRIERRAREAKAAGELTESAGAALLEEARAFVPKSRTDLLEELASDVDAIRRGERR